MRRWTGALLLLLLLACTTGCDDVKVNYDTAADFSAYQTYAWKAIDPEDKRQLERDFPKAAERLKAAINRELIDLGFSAAATEGANLLVSYHVALDVKRVGSSTDDLGRAGVAAVPVWSSSSVYSSATYHETVKKGTLVLSLEDRQENKLVWQGQFSSKFRDPSDLQPADIRKSIQKLFRNFPS